MQRFAATYDWQNAMTQKYFWNTEENGTFYTWWFWEIRTHSFEIETLAVDSWCWNDQRTWIKQLQAFFWFNKKNIAVFIDEYAVPENWWSQQSRKFESKIRNHHCIGVTICCARITNIDWLITLNKRDKTAHQLAKIAQFIWKIIDNH